MTDSTVVTNPTAEGVDAITPGMRQTARNAALCEVANMLKLPGYRSFPKLSDSCTFEILEARLRDSLDYQHTDRIIAELQTVLEFLNQAKNYAEVLETYRMITDDEKYRSDGTIYVPIRGFCHAYVGSMCKSLGRMPASI